MMTINLICLFAISVVASSRAYCQQRPQLVKIAAKGNVNPSRGMQPLNSIALEVSRNIAAIPVMYSLMSINEYIVHRYYQHTDFKNVPLLKRFKVKGGGHVEHHAETLDDMTLKTDERWKKTPASKVLDVDKYRGTAFNWEITGLMFVQLIVTCVPVLKALLGFNTLLSISLIIPSLLIHTLIWNALHPNMHGLPDIPWMEGPPAKVLAFLRTSKFFKYLYQNHEGHHVLGGQKNFNVCCPGFDHVLGTYVEEKSWRPKVKIPGGVVKV